MSRYFGGEQHNFEKDACSVSQREISGTPGVVTGGNSTRLKDNMLADMNVPSSYKPGNSGYQAHHIIPHEVATHPVVQKIGMDLDDASNGIFLRKPNDGINTKSVHYGYHREYSQAILNCLNTLDVNDSVEYLEKRVADLQQSARACLENGLPIYKGKDHLTGPVTYRNKGGGATQDLIEREFRRHFKLSW